MLRLILSVVRHIIGYFVLFPLIVLAVILQALIVAPIFGNRVAIPHAIYWVTGRFFGIRYALNPDSAKMSTDHPTMLVANHLSRVDFAGLYLFGDAAIMMNAAFFRMPVLGPLIRLFAWSAGIIGTQQSQAGKARDLTALAGALAEGRRLFVFPEGIQTDGRRILRYSKGTAEIFYDPALRARYQVLETAKVQPVVLRVKRVGRAPVLHAPDKWTPYANSRGRISIFAGILHSSMVRSVDIDVLVCPSLDPGDYPDAIALMQAAQDAARDIIAPDQSTTLTRAQWRERLDRLDYSL